MCEVMGLCFARPLSAHISIREFGSRGGDNADGWGLAWYPDRSLALVKEPVCWRTSPYTGFLETYHRLRSPIYVAHVRHKTVGGEPTHADTHPFARELDGRDYCFAHNGTLHGFAAWPLERFRPVGATDSEHAFCHLLEQLARRGGDLDGADAWTWLHDRLAALNRAGTLNCLLSDGRRLFCYHDATGYKGMTMRALDVEGADGPRLGDETVRVELDSEAADHGIAVASCPLSPTGWRPFRPGELLVLECGAVRYSSHRSADALAAAARD